MITICEGVKLSSKKLEVLKTVCEVCHTHTHTQRAKQTRLKFEDARTRAKRPLEIIHTDLYYLKEYVNQVEVHWNSKVSKIRCDNGKEFLNKDVQIWCKRKVIILDNTIPYTPQQNGKAESALLCDSSLGKEMWREALYCSTYILNRLPTDTLECTPYEMWEKRKPNLKKMQIFGSTAYVKTLGPLKKLEDSKK
ncbi:Copia protein [Cyphomyrmex costatus]|uniref:Copia protein n=1 Tax=Cyphomyrmex costatus TaxID=456900 RepID=A0A195CWL8_9HYME|nr:Copia protein [Cyphomyrmex costatus]